MGVRANLRSTIRADENITVFAPTDAAFAKVNPKVLAYLTQNLNVLKDVILYHMVGETVYSVGMRHAMSYHTMHDSETIMIFEEASGDIFVNHARVSERDISATNGVIHVIDKVLIPTKVYLTLESESIPVVG